MTRGRPKFKATPTLRRSVEELVSCGMAHDAIARSIGCSKPTLEKTFRDELVNGASRKRREVIGLLYVTARAKNVAAIKRLEELTSMTEALARPKEEAAPKLGKKAAAEMDAATCHENTEWGDLLN